MYLVSDDELEEEVLVVFRRHLRDCPRCAVYFDFLSELLGMVRHRCRPVPAPKGLEIRIRQRLSVLRSQGGTEAGR